MAHSFYVACIGDDCTLDLADNTKTFMRKGIPIYLHWPDDEQDEFDSIYFRGRILPVLTCNPVNSCVFVGIASEDPIVSHEQTSVVAIKTCVAGPCSLSAEFCKTQGPGHAVNLINHKTQTLTPEPIGVTILDNRRQTPFAKTKFVGHYTVFLDSTGFL